MNLSTADSTGARFSPVLNADQVAHYEAKGWLLVPKFFSDAETADIARWTDEVVAAPESPGRHMVYYETARDGTGRRLVQRIENFCPYHADFDGLVRRGRLARAVDALMGGPTVLFKEKINFKMPGGAGFEAHQDQQAGWSRYAPLFVTALVGIDRATIENGCLEMADGPRVTGMLGEEWKPLSAEELRDLPLKPVPTEPGDVLFFDSYAPHASQENRTDAPRRILYLTYNRAENGDHRHSYFAEKRANFPPDIERMPGVEYRFRV